MSSAFQSFVGVDLHKCTVTLTAVDVAGEITRLKISTKSTGKIDAWLRALSGPVWMAVEACPFVEWFIDRFRDCVQRIDIADATELANRRGKRRKTDRNDSLDIAHRLARGECPLGFIAPPELMQLRKLGRHWRHLSRLLSRSKHSMKACSRPIRGPSSTARAARLPGEPRPLEAGPATDLRRLTCMLTERHRNAAARDHLATRARSPRSCPAACGARHRQIWAAIIAANRPFERSQRRHPGFWAGLTADMKVGRTHSKWQHHQAGSYAAWALCQAAVTLCQAMPRSDSPTTGEETGQAQGQRRHGPAAAARVVRHVPRWKNLRARTGQRPNVGRQPNTPRKKETSGLTPETKNH
jgi:hypothetical protein